MTNREKEKIAELSLSIGAKIGEQLKFDIWDADDITQEIYLLIAEQMYPKYGVDAPESHYFTFCRNRLLNMRRDKMTHSDDKFKLRNALKLGNTDNYELDQYDEELREIIDEFADVIDNRISASLRESLLKYNEGLRLSVIERTKLREAIVVIVAAHKAQIGYDPDDE